MGERRKIIKKISAMLLTGMCLIFPINTYAQSCEIEQISLRMPDVRVYYRSDQQEQNYEAYLGGEALNYDKSSQFSELNEGVDYYILLDELSNSFHQKERMINAFFLLLVMSQILF